MDINKRGPKDNLVIENAELILSHRNFAGRKTEYNPENRRIFSTYIDMLPQSLIDQLISEGWNVKFTKPRDPQEDPRPYVQIRVKYGDFNNPSIRRITNHGIVEMDEEEIACLDNANIAHVDLIVRPYHWTARNESGVSLYLKSMYVEFYKDELEGKYEEY